MNEIQEIRSLDTSKFSGFEENKTYKFSKLNINGHADQRRSFDKRICVYIILDDRICFADNITREIESLENYLCFDLVETTRGISYQIQHLENLNGDNQVIYTFCTLLNNQKYLITVVDDEPDDFLTNKLSLTAEKILD